MIKAFRLPPLPNTITPIQRRKLVCLTGFMGSGKTTVGRLLASQLGWSWVDLDKRIADTAHRPVSDIFSQLGAAEFRRIESEQLAHILAETAATQKPRVISLGGGTMAQPQNLALLREHGALLIWLNCPLEELLHRSVRIADRPLFRDEASFRELWEERRATYELADHRIDSSGEPREVVEQILALDIFPKVTA